MLHTFLIKYGEIAIKGKNRHLFEDALIHQIKYALKPLEGEFLITKEQGRIYVEAQTDFDYEETVERLTHVFGIVGICPVVQLTDEGFEKLAQDVIAYLKERYEGQELTFKVHARRARKDYPIESMELNALLGGRILEAFPKMRMCISPS